MDSIEVINDNDKIKISHVHRINRLEMAVSWKSVEMDNLEQHFTSIFLVINIPFCQVFSRYTLSTNALNLFFREEKNHLNLLPGFLIFLPGRKSDVLGSCQQLNWQK